MGGDDIFFVCVCDKVLANQQNEKTATKILPNSAANEPVQRPFYYAMFEEVIINASFKSACAPSLSSGHNGCASGLPAMASS